MTGECQDGRGGESGIPGQQPGAGAHVLPQDVPLLAWRSPGEVPEGSKPEAECRGPAPARPHVFLFVGERLFHVAAEFSAELERQEAEQRAIGAPGV
jgi:hypothetical protein